MKPSVELALIEHRKQHLEDAAELVACLEAAAAAQAVAPFRVNVILEPTGCKRRAVVLGDAGMVVACCEVTPRVLAAVDAFANAGGRVSYFQRQKKRGAP